MSNTVKLGKHTFDVSEISQHKTELASKMWNETHGYKCNSDGSIKTNENGELLYTPKNVTAKQVVSIALFLLRQEMIVLRRRLPFFKALKEYIKRYTISLRFINTLTVEQVDNFIDWARFILTGKKKATATIESKVTEYLNQITEGMTEEKVSQFTTSLLTSLSEQVGKLNI